MKGKIIVCSIIVAIVSVCAIGYYVYDSSEETQKVKKHKKRVDYSYANQTNGEGAEDAHVSDVKTFTVNGVSFNMKFVYVGDSYFVIGSNIRGTGFRNSRFDVDHTEIEQEESEDSESEVSDNERDSDSEGESDSNEESDSENEDTDYRAGMSDGYDEWADYDEGPLHEASLSNPEFYMGETEVTVALWDAVMGDSVSKYVSPNFPITRVSWYDCCLFIDKLNKATGLKFRLPTETEWEFAACGGRVNDGYHRFSGSDDCTEVAWYTENSEDSIHEVASLQPNALGLYDMSGNVWEWCLDYYKDDYYYLCKYTDPLCQFDTKEKVLRGGSYLEPIQRVRSEQKKGRALNYYNEDCGFRLFLQLDSKDVYENICETDLKLYEYIPIYKYYKAEVEKTQPLRVRKDTIEDGIRYTINDDYSFVMKKVEGGVFSMGNPIEKRKVRLTYDYYISEVEVTNGLYNLVNRLSFERNEEQRPVVTISYGQVCDFIETLNNATGETFRLPTEAEWEFAAQGGNKSKSYTYSGTNNIKEVVTQRVGDVKQHNPNELGLYDMSGNVWEFCLDYYEEDFRKYLPNINPIGCPFATTTVIAKGGGADEDDIKNGSIYTSYSKR